MVRLDLEGLLVECRRLCKKAFGELVIRDPNELLDGLVVLAGPQVEVTERVDRVPVLRLVFHKTHVFLDRSIELSLAKQLLRLFQCRVSINCHRKEGLVLANLRIEEFTNSIYSIPIRQFVKFVNSSIPRRSYQTGTAA